MTDLAPKPALSTPHATSKANVLLLGGTGTIGRATAKALAANGHQLTGIIRPKHGDAGRGLAKLPPEATIIEGDATDPAFWAGRDWAAEGYTAIISCLASRTGAPGDAEAVDFTANRLAMETAQAAGISQFILLSAICVQKPKLAFQKAKLKAEALLQGSGLTWSIIRPTAFFKSLDGQIERVRSGKPFLVFGHGELTACKPISDDDLAQFIVGCIEDSSRHNRILPIGGPGPAITPLDQAAALSDMLGHPVKVRHVPVAMLDAIIGGLSLAGRFSQAARDKAEFARIGRYYATESMLVWDSQAGRYDAGATPEFGSRSLFDHYAALLAGEAEAERGEHAVF